MLVTCPQVNIFQVGIIHSYRQVSVTWCLFHFSEEKVHSPVNHTYLADLLVPILESWRSIPDFESEIRNPIHRAGYQPNRRYRSYGNGTVIRFRRGKLSVHFDGVLHKVSAFWFCNRFGRSACANVWPTMYRPVSKTDVSNTEKRLLQTIDMIINKKKRIAVAKHKSLSSSLSMDNSQSKSSIWDFLKTVSVSVTGSGESILCEGDNVCEDVPGMCITPFSLTLSVFLDISLLKQEISGLEELSRHLFLELHDVHNMMERAEWAKTWRGKYFNFLGYLFSLYCMWKIFIVSALISTFSSL